VKVTSHDKLATCAEANGIPVLASCKKARWRLKMRVVRVQIINIPQKRQQYSKQHKQGELTASSLYLE